MSETLIHRVTRVLRDGSSRREVLQGLSGLALAGEDGDAGQCVAVFGSQGSGEGQFQEPTGVAVNDQGQAFVTDTGNDRLVFLEGGEFDKANFAQPGPVAIGNNGQVYVTDLSIVRVIRLASDGTFLNSFGGQDDEEGNFLNPFGVAIDPFNDQVYVADSGNHRIQYFLANGQPLGLFGVQGAGAGELNEPRGVAVNRKSEVIVADSANHRIQVFEHRPVQNDFVLVRAFGSAGSGNGEFDTPFAVAVDDNDNIFVADLLNNRVQQFTDDGQFVAAFGRAGNAPGEFNRPTAIAVDRSGLIYVVDQGNHRVQRFSPPGTGVTAADRRASRKGRAGSRN